MPNEPEFYIAIDDGYTVDGDQHYKFSRHVTTVQRGHPLLKCVPGAFKPFVPTYPWPPEGADADPAAKPASGRGRGAKTAASR